MRYTAQSEGREESKIPDNNNNLCLIVSSSKFDEKFKFSQNPNGKKRKKERKKERKKGKERKTL